MWQINCRSLVCAREAVDEVHVCRWQAMYSSCGVWSGRLVGPQTFVWLWSLLLWYGILQVEKRLGRFFAVLVTRFVERGAVGAGVLSTGPKSSQRAGGRVTLFVEGDAVRFED